MTPTSSVAGSAGIKCSGQTIAGEPCRRLTRDTVEVAGVPHAACPSHAAQVKAREVELDARKAARLASGGPESPREAGLIAVRTMAYDWYCPSDERLPRVSCRECVAEVALDAYEGFARLEHGVTS